MSNEMWPCAYTGIPKLDDEISLASKTLASIPQSPRLQDQLLCVLRFRHYNLPTKEACLQRVKFFRPQQQEGK